jgi:hypothetical protein
LAATPPVRPASARTPKGDGKLFATSFRVLTVAGALAFATAATAAVKYTSPKMDFSKVQKEFRIGFLGDEASKDILTRNAYLKDYVEAAYNVPAKMFTFKDYAGTMESMLGGNLDYAWRPQKRNRWAPRQAQKRKPKSLGGSSGDHERLRATRSPPSAIVQISHARPHRRIRARLLHKV